MKTKTKVIWGSILGILIMGVTLVRAFSSDPIGVFGTLQFLNAGATAFIQSTNASTSLTLYNGTSGNNDIVVDSSDRITIGGSNFGQVVLPLYTKSQIDTLVPKAVGALIIDTNGTLANQVCIATGTLAGQWRALQGGAGLGCGSGN